MPFSSTDPDTPIFDRAEGSPRSLPIEGTDVMQARHVVIRTIDWQAGRSEALERFHSEMLALARLHHPHLERIHHLFRAPDHYLAVFEQAQGEPLDEMLRRSGAISWQAATSLMCQALDGLQHAHLHGVVHRDVRPANLAVTGSGELKVCSFGVLRGPYADNVELTAQFDSSLAYMAPEQIRGEPGDCRIDVYAVGAILFEILTGQPLFAQSSDYELMLAVVREEPVPPQTLNPAIPDRLQAAILRALAKSGRQRFQTAFEFRAELAAILANEGSWTTTEGSAEPLAIATPVFTPRHRPQARNKPASNYRSAARKLAQSFQRRLPRSFPTLPAGRTGAAVAGLAVVAFAIFQTLQPTAPTAPEAQLAAPDRTVEAGGLPATSTAEARGATVADTAGTSAAPAPAEAAPIASQALSVTDWDEATMSPEPLVPATDADMLRSQSSLVADRVIPAAIAASEEPEKMPRKHRTRVSYREIRGKLHDGGWKIISD